MKRQALCSSPWLLLLMVSVSVAQLDQTFDKIFDQVLRTGFARGSPGAHGNHFLRAADEANQSLTPTLTSLIAGNISSFPLSSTLAGGGYDLSSGEPVKISESLGPIFAEAGYTLGKGKINLGFNYTYLSLNKLRGVDTRDLRFTFTHEDVSKDGTLGDNQNESDLVDVFLNLDATASLLALTATYGVTHRFDIGVAVPLVNLSLSGNAQAVVNSYTFAALGFANHHFGPPNTERTPDLVEDIPYDESTTGMGDVALRAKYNVYHSADLDVAALLDVRLATGNKNDFLGTGKNNMRLSWILSKRMGDFSPHVNLGYDRRGAERDSDEFELLLGFDQKLGAKVTFAAELFGELDLNTDETIALLPGTKTFNDVILSGTTVMARQVRQIRLSNVPERDNDNTFNTALGFRAAPSERLILFGNIIVPLNDAGLRSSVAPTFGATLSF